MRTDLDSGRGLAHSKGDRCLNTWRRRLGRGSLTPSHHYCCRGVRRSEGPAVCLDARSARTGKSEVFTPVTTTSTTIAADQAARSGRKPGTVAGSTNARPVVSCSREDLGKATATPQVNGHALATSTSTDLTFTASGFSGRGNGVTVEIDNVIVISVSEPSMFVLITIGGIGGLHVCGAASRGDRRAKKSEPRHRRLSL